MHNLSSPAAVGKGNEDRGQLQVEHLLLQNPLAAKSLSNFSQNESPIQNGDGGRLGIDEAIFIDNTSPSHHQAPEGTEEEETSSHGHVHPGGRPSGGIQQPSVLNMINLSNILPSEASEQEYILQAFDDNNH